MNRDYGRSRTFKHFRTAIAALVLSLPSCSAGDAAERRQVDSVTQPVVLPDTYTPIWKAPLGAEMQGLCGMKRESLNLLEVAAAGSLMFVKLHQDTADGVDTSYATPEVLITQNEITTASSTSKGVVGLGEDAWISIELADIPEGDSEVSIIADGRIATLPLRKLQGSVKYLPMTERSDLHWEEGSVGVDLKVGPSLIVEVE
jgi:hypothetical protein